MKRSGKEKSSITKKAKTGRNRAQEREAVSRFDILVEESQKFCVGVGLHKDLMLEIAKTDSDWAFILKIDALLETASKGIIRHGLRLKILNRVITNDVLGDFVVLTHERENLDSKIAGSCGMSARRAGFYRSYS